MIDSLEFKLKSGEFKLLQYLKIKNDDTQVEIAYQINMSDRQIRDNLKMLELLNVINIHKKSNNRNSYTINNSKEWTL
jgi:DNA-binding MarR family transcriptional regulator